MIVAMLRESGHLFHELPFVAQLSALLAVQEAGDLPGDGAVVHRRRPQRPARPHVARRSARCQWLPAWGKVADRRDGLAAARLVHQPPALLGRADPGARLRVMPGPAPDGRDRPPFPRPVPHEGADAWFSRPVEEFVATWSRIVQNAAGASFRKEGDILDVWFESGSSHRAVLGRGLRPRAIPRSCTWKARTSTAAGSSRRS